MTMSDRLELAGLAHRRYPSMPLDLAVECFLSDRRHAGLGALDERKRKGVAIRNYKRDVWSQVRYHLERHEKARVEFVPQPWEGVRPRTMDEATMTVQTVKIPEQDQHLCVPADYRDLRDQSGRRMIARSLREARRQLRAR